MAFFKFIFSLLSYFFLSSPTVEFMNSSTAHEILMRRKICFEISNGVLRAASISRLIKDDGDGTTFIIHNNESATIIEVIILTTQRAKIKKGRQPGRD